MVGLSVSISRSISGAGLVGFSGATTAPTPTAARYEMTKYGVLLHSSATTWPSPTPSAVSSALSAAVLSRRSP